MARRLIESAGTLTRHTSYRLPAMDAFIQRHIDELRLAAATINDLIDSRDKIAALHEAALVRAEIAEEKFEGLPVGEPHALADVLPATSARQHDGEVDTRTPEPQVSEAIHEPALADN